MPNALVPLRKQAESLAERFWSIARGIDAGSLDPDRIDAVRVVRHVLAILDAVENGATGEGLSVTTLSFLQLLREHQTRGDLSYASPEQIRGETMDERSLVFSVGVLVFERLTGRHPFGAEGNNPRRLARIRKGEFGSGVNYFPTVPANLRAVLMRAMGPFPEERYATLRDLRVHLEQFCAGQRPRLPGTTRPRPKPSTDTAPTRVVDMTQHARRERALVTGRAPTQQAPAHLRPLDISAFDERAEVAPKADPAQVVAPKAAPLQVVAPQAVLPQVLASKTSPQVVASSPQAVAFPHIEPGPDPLLQQARLYVPDLKKRSRLAPLAWATGGAAIASIALLLLHGSGTDTDRAAVHPATAAAAPARPVPKVEPLAASVARDEDRDEPARFDPAIGGAAIVAASRRCIPPGRLRAGVQFGIGVVYPSEGARRRKLFFAGNQLRERERRCLHHELRRVTAGAPPARTQLVDYRIRVSTRDHQIAHELN